MVLVKRETVRRERGRRRLTPAAVPAPFRGWNTTSVLGAMEPEEAVVMDNWFPSDGDVRVRKGYEEFATGVGAGNVDFLVEYRAGTTLKFLAASATEIFDITGGGAASSVKSGFTSGQWHSAQFSGSLFLVNGVDPPQDYDGTTMSATAWTGPADINKLVGVHSFKNRLFFIESDSQDFWYGALDAVTGALTTFPLSRVGTFGGNLVAIETWSRDAGDGPDDFAVFFMSSGEVLVYQGSNPGDATAWALVGIFHIGQPLHANAIAKFGADVLVATTGDYVLLSNVIEQGGVGEATKVAGAVREAWLESAPTVLFGWQIKPFQSAGIALANVPRSDGSYDQHVVNTNSGAWCRYKDIPARFWEVFDGELYFGSTDGRVHKAETGFDDDGTAIEAECKQAWNNFDFPGRKRVTAIRALVSSTAAVNYSITFGADFEAFGIESPTSISNVGTPWGSPWGSSWGRVDFTDTEWRVQAGTGEFISVGLKVSALQEISWRSTGLKLQFGSGL